MATTRKQKRTIAAVLTGLVAVASLVAAFTGQLTAIATNIRQLFVPGEEAPPSTPMPNGPPATPAPKPEAPFDHRKPINAFGGWEHRGDTNMDTNSKDPVTAKTRTKVHWSADRIDIDVSFECAEYGGDGTAYFGTRTFPVYAAPPDKKIVDVTAQGPLERHFLGSTRGKQHDPIAYNTTGTFWDSLRYRIDTKDDDDSPHVGVGGELIISIQLAPK